LFTFLVVTKTSPVRILSLGIVTRTSATGPRPDDPARNQRPAADRRRRTTSASRCHPTTKTRHTSCILALYSS
jgi:hypothetical protein